MFEVYFRVFSCLGVFWRNSHLDHKDEETRSCSTNQKPERDLEGVSIDTTPTSVDGPTLFQDQVQPRSSYILQDYPMPNLLLAFIDFKPLFRQEHTFIELYSFFEVFGWKIKSPLETCIGTPLFLTLSFNAIHLVYLFVLF